METTDWNIFAFPCTSDMARRRALRKDLLNALRPSGAAVIVDFSECGSLNHEDIDLLLECMEKVAGRDTRMVLVAGSRENRVILELTRISSLVPVFTSLPEALADSKVVNPVTRTAVRSQIVGSA